MWCLYRIFDFLCMIFVEYKQYYTYVLHNWIQTYFLMNWPNCSTKYQFEVEYGTKTREELKVSCRYKIYGTNLLKRNTTKDRRHELRIGIDIHAVSGLHWKEIHRMHSLQREFHIARRENIFMLKPSWVKVKRFFFLLVVNKRKKPYANIGNRTWKYDGVKHQIAMFLFSFSKCWCRAESFTTHRTSIC